MELENISLCKVTQTYKDKYDLPSSEKVLTADGNRGQHYTETRNFGLKHSVLNGMSPPFHSPFQNPGNIVENGAEKC